MSIISQGNKNKGKVYRCLAIYNIDHQDFTLIQKRKCGKSFDTSIQELKQKTLECFNKKITQLNCKCNQGEWFGLMDQQQKCYFFLMIFHQSNMERVTNALNQIIKSVTSIPNYWLLANEELDQQKKNEIRKLLDNLENEYIEKEGGGQGNPSDEDQGSKINSAQASKINQQNSFRQSNNSKIQDDKKKNEYVHCETKDKEKEYIDFGVIRGFLIFNLREQKDVFTIRRGSKNTFQESLPKLKENLNHQQKDNNICFHYQYNQKGEWHGMLDQENYYLLMTFTKANQQFCQSILKNVQQIFVQKQYFQQQQNKQLQDSLYWEIQFYLKSEELHYECQFGVLDTPSDNEEYPKLDDLKKHTMKMTKNYNTFSATRQEILNSQILSKQELQKLGEKEINSPIQTQNTLMEKLQKFQPKITDTEEMLSYGLGVSILILLFLFVCLFII